MVLDYLRVDLRLHSDHTGAWTTGATKTPWSAGALPGPLLGPLGLPPGLLLGPLGTPRTPNTSSSRKTSSKSSIHPDRSIDHEDRRRQTILGP